MKWFHHETAARRDPKLQILGSTHGAEGIGIFWSVMEEIGNYSDIFHLKVTGVSKKADAHYAALVQARQEGRGAAPGAELEKIPAIPLKLLASNLFTEPRTLRAVINTCARIGLFDAEKWFTYGLIYSAPFEHRADEYTRKRKRRTARLLEEHKESRGNGRTMSGQCPDTLLTSSEEFGQELERDGEEEEKKIPSPFSFSFPHSSNAGVATKQNSTMTTLSPEEFHTYSLKIKKILQEWNQDHESKFDWNPTHRELRSLFYGGDQRSRSAMCYQAMNLLEGELSYPELVLRAVRMMLKASEKHRVAVPFAWLWASLHGSSTGAHPWAQLTTAEEEALR